MLLSRQSPNANLSIRRQFWSTRHDDLNRALSEAEKIVGYPTSFLNLRYLLSDEISNIAMYMKRFAMSKHPMLRTARGFVSDDNQTMQTRGLLVLLISKASGQCMKNELNMDQELVADIHSSQRQLADITETIHTASLVHTGIVDLASISSSSKCYQEDMEFGNKMAVLSGDFLLANACTGLAELKDTEVVQMISEVIGHLMEGEFLKITFNADNLNLEFWNELSFKCKASLMANSCKAALKIVGHSVELQETAFEFGKNIGFAHQLKKDLQALHDEKSTTILHTAPVIISSKQPHVKTLIMQILAEKNTEKLDDLLQELAFTASQGETSSTMKDLSLGYGKKALQSLQLFPDSDAKQALVNIANSCTLQV
ncbi:Decaprenyl-diphosphate synthase subunit 2 [Stylophora pistillata]|uniref:Decaprenyl-diphosphate synthase subunit 2 n=2 Tax=Stylophora pistillata TaxID=50429 RepID=A0A2B4SZP9_STYPI|nr:Decaprenyl-diphosphate synthase subunit 2 [Stylophora pistillata]